MDPQVSGYLVLSFTELWNSGLGGEVVGVGIKNSGLDMLSLKCL